MQRNRMPTYLLGAAAIAAVLVLVGIPLAALVPFVLVLACPLMMLLMMRGMSGMGGGEDHEDRTDPERGARPR